MPCSMKLSNNYLLSVTNHDNEVVIVINKMVKEKPAYASVGKCNSEIVMTIVIGVCYENST